MTALGLIFAEIDTRLSAVDGVEEYERMPTGDPARFRALHVYDDGDGADTAEGDEPAASRQQLTIHVEGFVQGLSGAASHDDLLSLHADTVKALCGDEGMNLGGLVEKIETAGDRRIDTPQLGEVRRLAFAQDFTITYAIVRGDPNTLVS